VKKHIMKKVLIAASAVSGIIILALAFNYTGVHDFRKLIAEGSLFFLLLFLASSFLEFIAMSVRWQRIIKSEGGSVSILQALSYRIMGHSVNYITPAARVGGEPLMAYMLNKHGGMTLSRGLSSVIIDKAFELCVEFILSAFFVLALLIFVPLPEGFKTIAILIVIGGLLIPSLFFYALLREWGPLSAVFRLFAKLSRHKIVHWAKEKAVKVERYVHLFFRFRIRDNLISVALTAFVWAFRFLEYKLALLVFGYNASFIQIFAAGIVWGIAGLIPIPAAIGILEAGQMSLFAAFGARPEIGLALALALRVRDILYTLTGVYLISHERVSFFDALKKNS
jgi:glycosyltransferase 2 family protein